MKKSEWSAGMYMVHNSETDQWDYEYLTQDQIDHFKSINKWFQPPSAKIKPTFEQKQKYCSHGTLNKANERHGGYVCRTCLLHFPDLVLTATPASKQEEAETDRRDTGMDLELINEQFVNTQNEKELQEAIDWYRRLGIGQTQSSGLFYVPRSVIGTLCLMYAKEYAKQAQPPSGERLTLEEAEKTLMIELLNLVISSDWYDDADLLPKGIKSKQEAEDIAINLIKKLRQ